jgi:hypothetical protein
MAKPIVEIPGTIRGTGYRYKKDEVEALEIWVNKKGDQRFLNQDHIRVPVVLSIGSQQYTAGVSFTPKFEQIWINPNLVDKNNREVKLAYPLSEAGFAKNNPVILRIEEWKISVAPANLSPNPLIRKGS